MSVGYPRPGVPAPAVSYRPPSGGTAETLVLIALVLQVIGGLLVLGGIAWFFGFAILFPFPWAWAAVTAAGVVALVVIIFLYLAYTTSYQRIQRGEYQAAQAPTLVLGILSLFLGIVPGILYLVGYVKLGDAIREQQGYGAYAMPPAPPMTPPAWTCPGCRRVYAAGSVAFCPACGARLAA